MIREHVIKMLNVNYDINAISEITSKSKEEILEIKEEFDKE